MNNPCVTDPAALPSAFDHAPNTRDMDALLALYDPAAIFRASDGILQRGIPALKSKCTAS